jgi:archaellum biogenesis ATPase FlaH
VDAKLSLALANGAPEEEKQRLWKEREESGESRVETKEPSSLLDVLSPEYLEGLQEEGNDNEFIKLWPRVLNDRLDGGALRGHHVLVFARPETGKTLFSINLTAGFLHQGLNVLYVGNEEPAADYRDRIYGRLLKVGKAFVRDNRADVSAALARANIGRVHLAEATSFGDVRRSLESGSFSVVILDQIRNMRLSSESRTAELEAAGIEARSIAKEYNVLVVSITQAGNSADGKVYLEMGDVDSSKTGLPASADLMIGLGCDEPMKANGLLGVSLPKNKLSGLHDRFTVACNFQTGVVE